MRYVLFLLLILLLFLAGLALYVGSGTYNVSARVPHFEATLWFLDTFKDRSIVNHSQGITVPATLRDTRFSAEGFRHYHEACRTCHGAPGVSREAFAMGLYPAPPMLASGHPQAEWSEGQLFWIVKNGLKFTGMPAFGITHDEQQIWSIVAFLGALPRISPEAYEGLMGRTGTGTDPQPDHHEGRAEPGPQGVH